MRHASINRVQFARLFYRTDISAAIVAVAAAANADAFVAVAEAIVVFVTVFQEVAAGALKYFQLPLSTEIEKRFLYSRWRL